MYDYTEPSSIDLHVALKIKNRRKELGISQRCLATLLGITFQQVQKYENGTNRISASRLYQLSKFLDTTVSYFFSGFTNNDQALYINETHATYSSDDSTTDDEAIPYKDLKNLETYYKKIHDPKLRKKVLNLVKQIAQ